MIRDGQVGRDFGDADPAEAALAIASLIDGLTVQVASAIPSRPAALARPRRQRRATARLRAARPPLVSIEEMMAAVDV